MEFKIETKTETNRKKSRALLKKKKLIHSINKLNKDNNDVEVKKTIRMPKSLATKLKIVSAITNKTQAELISYLLNNYMDIEDMYNSKLQPLLDQVDSGEIEMVKYKPKK